MPQSRRPGPAARETATFGRLIDLKDKAHYGVMVVSRGEATRAVRWAGQLVARAQEEAER